MNNDQFEQEASSVETDKQEAARDAVIYTVSGFAVGAGTSAAVGGMGLAVAGTAVGIGMAPVAAAGAVTGSAIYGVKKAVEDQDATALGAAAVGVAGGAGVAALVGGMGLAVGGTAIAIGMTPVAVVGGILGLAGYGAKKTWDQLSK